MELKPCIAVPIDELEKLESARVALFRFLETKIHQHEMPELLNITQQIWMVANRKGWGGTPTMSADEARQEKLNCIADQLQWWIDWTIRDYEKSGMEPTDDNHMMRQWPEVPRIGVIKNWIEVLRPTNTTGGLG